MRQLRTQFKFLLVFLHSGFELLALLVDTRDLLLGLAHFRLEVSRCRDQISVSHARKLIHGIIGVVAPNIVAFKTSNSLLNGFLRFCFHFVFGYVKLLLK